METKADAVIIGGGISGCAAAYYLAKRNLKVVLVEKGEIGGEAPGRNSGGVRSQGRNPAECPFVLEAMRMWPGLENELQADMGFRQGGNLLCVEDEKDMEELEIGAQLAKETGVDSRIITPAEAREVVPGLDIPLVGALYSASDGHAEPEKSTRAFAMAAQEQGAKLYTDCAALGIETSNGRVTSVNTDRGRVETPWVVNAAGVWANYLARKLGHRFPVKVIRMTVGLTEPVKTRIDPFVRSPNCGFRQTPEGNVLFSRGFGRPRDYDMGRDMFDDLHIWLPYLIKHHKLVSLNLGWELPRSFHARTPLLSRVGRLAPLRVDIEPKVNRKTLTGGLAALVRAMPALKGVRIERSWAGLIDITPDMIPVFGPVPGLEGYILAAGFSGHGFAMGPMTGRLISEIVIDGKPSISLDAFRLDRFGRGMKISAPRNFVR